MFKVGIVFCCILPMLACSGDTRVLAPDTYPVTAEPNFVPLTPEGALANTVVRQAVRSIEEQADVSEVVSSGVDDGSGTRAAEQQHPGATLYFEPQPTADLSQPLSYDFNVMLHREAYINPDGSRASGRVSATVRPVETETAHISLSSTLAQSDAKNLFPKQTTSASVMLTKRGTRATGLVVREFRGVVQHDIESASDSVNSIMRFEHITTVVTDVYRNSSLANRTINGKIAVRGVEANAQNPLEFKETLRATPRQCLCPTAGKVFVDIKSSFFIFTFTDDCGRVTSTEVPGFGHAVLDNPPESSLPSEQVQSDSNTTASAIGTNNKTSPRIHTIDSEIFWEDCHPKESFAVGQ